MSDLNQVTVTGRLGADPEIRRTQDGRPIGNLRVAVSQSWRDKNSGERKERAEWVPVVIYSEGLCKIAEQYLRKGSRVLVQGEWKTRKWADQSGNDRYTTEVTLQGFDAKLIMLDGPSGERQSKPQQRDQSSYDDYDEPKGQGQAANFSRDLDDDIPFLMEWR